MVLIILPHSKLGGKNNLFEALFTSNIFLFIEYYYKNSLAVKNLIIPYYSHVSSCSNCSKVLPFVSGIINRTNNNWKIIITEKKAKIGPGAPIHSIAGKVNEPMIAAKTQWVPEPHA